MKKILVFSSILLGSILLAQSGISERLISKGYIKANTKEFSGKTHINSSSTEFYDSEGNVLTKQDIMSKMQSGGNVMDFYLDKDKNIKALVVRPEASTDEKRPVMFAPNYTSTNVAGQPAPSFRGMGLDGKEYSSEQLKGKVVVMNFWFDKCQPCIQELPQLNKLREKYKGNSDVVFLAATFDSEKQVRKFTKKNSFAYQILPAQKNIIHSYKIMVFPTHIIIDRKGKISHVTDGFVENIEEILDKNIQKVL